MLSFDHEKKQEREIGELMLVPELSRPNTAKTQES